MKLKSSRFGELEVNEEKMIFLPHGLFGFPEVRRYVLLDHYREAPFQWLQAVDDPDLAFLVMNPLIFKPDFRLDVQLEGLAELEVKEQGDLLVLVIVTIPKGRPEKMTANLQGPLVVNLQNRKAKQLVLMDAHQYPCRYPLFPKGIPEERSMAGMPSQ